MSATDTQAPPADDVVTEEPMEETGRKFAQRMADKARAGWHWAKALFKRSAAATKSGTVTAAKATWAGARWSASKVAWAGTGALAFVGNTIYTVVRLVGTGVTYLVAGVGLVAMALIGVVVFVVMNLIYLAVKVVHLVALLLCSPWIALHSREALKEDWEIFWTGCKPRNWHIMSPQALAAQTLRERQAKSEQRAASAAASDGKASRTGTKKQQSPKGRPTPSQRVKRAPRMPAASAAATA